MTQRLPQRLPIALAPVKAPIALAQVKPGNNSEKLLN